MLVLLKSERRKNNCYLVSADKNEVFLFSKGINIKHGWLLHRKPMFDSRNPKTTGGFQRNRVNCWLQKYNKFSRKALNLKNESRYFIISF